MPILFGDWSIVREFYGAWATQFYMVVPKLNKIVGSLQINDRPKQKYKLILYELSQLEGYVITVQPQQSPTHMYAPKDGGRP